MKIFFLDFDFTSEFLPVILLIVNYLCYFVYGYKMSCKIVDIWMPGGTIPKGPNEMGRHLGYPLGWNATGKRKVEWVLEKVRQKLSYWKIATWPLHVRLRIVKSIFMAYMQYYLIMID